MKHILLALLIVSSQAEAATLHVVELVNFSCKYCAAAEAYSSDIESAVVGVRGNFSVAPISSGANVTAADDVYYAARRESNAVKQQLRTSLFKGIQEYGQPFENGEQVLFWLGSDLKAMIGPLERIRARLGDEDGLKSKNKAHRLAGLSGVDSLPAFVFISKGRIIDTLQRDEKEQSIASLSRRVIARIKELSNAK